MYVRRVAANGKTLYKGGDKDAQPSAYLKSKLDAQLYIFGTQPHFCIAYVIGCFYSKLWTILN